MTDLSEVSIFLKPTEVFELTGKKRRSSQTKALNKMGIEHKVRPDGEIVILRSHVEKILDGNTKTFITPKRTEPDWSSLAASP